MNTLVKRVFTTAAFSLCIAAMNPTKAQAQNEVLPKHEFTINGFGGLSTLRYSVDGADLKKGFGGGGGFGYHYFFNDHWGLVTGLEAALYKASLSMPSIESGQYVRRDNGQGYYNEYILHNKINSFKETQTLWALQLPVMVQWLAPLGEEKKNHFFLALGGRLGYTLSGKYRQSAESVDYTYRNDRYYWSPENAYIVNLEGYDSKASLKFAKFNAALSAETGVRWKLGEKMSLYTGLYLDYGLMNMIPGKSNEALLMNIDSGEGNPSEYEKYTNNSILVAHAPDYGGIPQGQQIANYVRNNDRYTDKVNTLAFGLKIKLAFGCPKKKAAPEPEPLPVAVRQPKPEPEVEPEAEPEEEPVIEVPQEIKQAMLELSNTLFEFNRVNLSGEAIADLNKVADWLIRNPGLRVEVEGHTDNVGTPEYNQKLSEERAKTVYDYFIAHGVQASRISYKGYGLTRPIADNSTDEGRRQNRRVELIIK